MNVLKNKKNKLLMYIIISMLLISCIEIIKPSTNAEASQSKTVLIYQKEISKDMNWENPKWVSYPNSEYGTYQSTYNYDSGGYTGTLTATRIKLVPKEKVYHKDPVYRTDYQTFTKYASGTYGTKDNANISSTYSINENGYTGTIPRTDISWTDNWVTGRTQYLTQYWTDWAYREFWYESPVPNTYDGWYYDSPSGQSVWYSLPKSGGLYSVGSRNEWIRYRAPGSAFYYDKYENYYLGFMSSNSSTYYAGNFSAAKPGEAPDRYYGIPRYYVGFQWRLVDYGWDEPYAVNADTFASMGYGDRLVYSNGSYWWRSESGRLNKWRKGAWIDYDLYVPTNLYQHAYSGTFNLPNYINNYTANATYSGQLSKQVLDHYNEYYTSSKWDVSVEYTGTIYSKNLTAKSIVITDLNNNPVTHLVKGKLYKATMVVTNNGDLDVGAYKVGFYEQGTLKTSLDISSHSKGTDKTLTYNFTASTSGTPRNFMMKADDVNVINETNETDNSISQSKNVHFVNLNAKSINITNPDGSAASYLVRGKTYKATMVISNDGEIDTGAYKVGFYEQGTLKTSLDVTSHTKGTDKTLTYDFTASTSGTPRIFMMKADDLNVIEESNESDNTVSQNKNVHYVNLNAKSINITNPDGIATSYLVRGKTYKATMVISNDGEIDTGAYKVGFYEQGTLKTSLDVTSHLKGTDKTLTYNFTASTSGTPRTFMMKADDLDMIEESNESDNSISQNKNVHYVNLNAASIVITDLNDNVVEHLVKGKQYKAKMVSTNQSEIDVGAYKVGFYEQGRRNALLDVTSHAKGTDKSLTYQFTATTSGNRTFMVKVDDADVIEESNENDNTSSITKLVNTLPVITVSYSPSDVYEGDTVSICTKPTDADNNPLTVNIYLKKGSGVEQLVLNQSHQSNGSQQCYSFISQVDRYDIRATVYDGYDQTEATTWFYSKALILNGYVKHTPLWLSKHQALGHATEQFYSGEKFLLEADTSPYPTIYVKSTLKTSRVNNLPISSTVNLGKSSDIFYNGELFDQSFLEYPTNIKVGPAVFEFEVKYTNGVIKTKSVPIEIISDSFKAYKLHRKY